MAQTWSELLFAHWPVAPQKLREFVPQSLEIDLFDGTAWIGVVPFRMSDVCLRGLVPIPYLSNFLELNVRTYVTFQGKSGVYFFSLDASNPVAVLIARKTYLLPYFHAAMTCITNGDAIEYSCKRYNSPSLAFQASYAPTASITYSKPGSLEYFLTERYCLFVSHKDRGLYCGDIHHNQWPLQTAAAEIRRNTMTDPLGLNLSGTRPLLHFVKSLDTIEWAITKIC
jgi:uncharacterized protein YqjF (DUF2071 family)